MEAQQVNPRDIGIEWDAENYCVYFCSPDGSVGFAAPSPRNAEPRIGAAHVANEMWLATGGLLEHCVPNPCRFALRTRVRAEHPKVGSASWSLTVATR